MIDDQTEGFDLAELRVKLAGLINQGAYLHVPEADCKRCAESYATADHLLAAGWRPEVSR